MRSDWLANTLRVFASQPITKRASKSFILFYVKVATLQLFLYGEYIT